MHRIFAGMAVWASVFLVAQVVLGVLTKRVDPSWVTLHLYGGVLLGIYLCILHVGVMFHFIGSGKEIKEHAAILGDNADIVKTLRRFKMLTSPLATFAPLITGAAIILGGSAHMKVLPGWVHWGLALAALVFNLVAFPVEYRCLKLNVELINEVDARIRREIAPAMFRSETP